VALVLPGLGGGPAQSSRLWASGLRDSALLFQLPVYRRILVIAALVEGSHALNDTFAVIRWRSAGVDLTTISVLWSESVLAEVLVFLWFGARLIRRVSAGVACVLAAGAGMIRWSVVACTTSPILVGLVQPLHGVTFALLHLACIRVIASGTSGLRGGSSRTQPPRRAPANRGDGHSATGGCGDSPTLMPRRHCCVRDFRVSG
jgi:hypothetical protein